MNPISEFFNSAATIYNRCSGEFVLWRDFQSAFYAHNPTTSLKPAKLRKELTKASHPVGPGSRNRLVVGNVSDTLCKPRKYVMNKNGDVRLELRQIEYPHTAGFRGITS